MRSSLRAAAFMAALLATLVLAPTAGAAVKAKAALLRAGDAVQIEVKITSTRAFTAATRPRSVKAGGLTLKRTAAGRKAMTWRSAPQTGAAATRLEQLGGTRAAVKITTRAGSRTLRAQVTPAPAPAPVTPAPGATPPPAAGAPSPPPDQSQLTRNDAAGQAAMTGDLLLEWAEFGSSGRTADYRRLWFMGDGTFRRNVISWNDVSGESCTETVTGTWTFKEGYTTDARGGLVIVKLGITTPGGSGDDILTFANSDQNAVYVGTQGVRYERNPQIRAC